jgi:tetratricopeptide (TPR) repeat protein
LQDQLSRILEASVETRNESAVALDYESRKALESLGYVSGAVDSNLKFDQDREDPKDLLGIHIDLGVVPRLTHDKQFDKGIKLCNKIIARRPDIAPTYRLLAEIYIKLESYDKAIEFAKKKLALLPGDIESLKFLAQTHRDAGNYRQAIDYINTILKLEGDAADTYYYRARNYHSLDDAAQALQDYLKALQLDPEYLPARIHAAEVYEKAGKLKQAVEHYEIALRQNPDLALKHNIVAWIQATQKDPAVYDPKSALAHAEKAVELARDENSRAHVYYPYFLDTLAVAQSVNGQFDAAIETAGLALKLCRERELVSEAEEIAERLELYKRGETYRE